MFASAVALACLGAARAQMPGMGGMPSEARPVAKSAKALECAVCKVAIGELHVQSAAARATAPYGKLGEMELQELAGDLCDPDLDARPTAPRRKKGYSLVDRKPLAKPSTAPLTDCDSIQGGEWITYYDILQEKKGDRLKLEKQEYLGECRRECRTIVKVLDEQREDIAELLYKEPQLSEEKLKSRVCQKWAKKCPEKPPSPSYAHPDEYWMPVDEEMYRMKKMQQSINEQATKHRAGVPTVGQPNRHRNGRRYGKQPVQFVDPMQSMMFADDEGEL